MICCSAHVIHALYTLSTLYKLDFLLRLQTRTVFFLCGICAKTALVHVFSVFFLFKEIPPHFCCERSEWG